MRSFDEVARSGSAGRGAPTWSLVGRDEEFLLTRRFLRQAAVNGGALLISGEAGVGKTALLDAVGDAAAETGTRVLRAAGVEFEADVSYSGLNQLLFPLYDAFAELAPVHRDALRVALGFGPGQPPDRLLVSNAVLLLLRSLATARPLLLVVDDLPWLDRASSAVLGFVARRLVGTSVGFLAASRSQTAGFFELGGIPELELQPLPPAAADELINQRFPGLAPAVRRRLLSEARGNPLALLELPTALSGPQRLAAASLPAVLPLTRRLQTLFASRVAQLPEPCRRLLLLGALDGTGELGVLLAAAGEHDLDDLEPAERDQLVRVHGNTRRFTFRHPLIESAVVEVATSGELRWAHSALARTLVGQPERSAWHLGEATVGPDERVAALLEQAAHRILRRGDAVGAIASLTRSADLTPDPVDRGRRLAQAAYIGADAGGELTNASQLLADARRASPGGSLYATTAAVYLLLNSDGDVRTAHRLLVGAIESGDHGYRADDHALLDAMHTLLLLCFFSGEPALWEPFFAALDRLTPKAPELLTVAAATFGDPVRTAQAAAGRFDAIVAGMSDEVDPTEIVRIGIAAIYLDRLSDCRDADWRVVRLGRDGAAPARRHLGVLLHLCFDDYHGGRWDEAAELAEEGVRLCDEHGFRFFTWYFQYIQALLAAARGDGEGSDTLTEVILRFAVPRGARAAEFYAYHVRGLNDLARGDHESAYQHASLLSPAGTFAPYAPHAMWACLDLVEAAVRTGRHTEAAAHAAAIRDADLATVSSRLALLAAAASAVAAPDDAAEELFEAALALPDVERWPFDLARVRLAYGERLRRARATAKSRAQLRAALATFELLDARPWVERASNELRATGLAKPRSVTRSTVLTPQEREIAELAGSGLTNKQIGEKLFLSHRTVGTHLYQIFPKLGITSRAALRDALAALGDDEASEPDEAPTP
ncbi:helix-turn-helix transcriptional regulator [Micromonospora costi]|uniref:LuxR family transcriptional regulator n=1 Tax=Micromonospora costi TaxID=1530042 RepID=A0A3B0AFI8_9ACTN|nr:LuxR family transcriptional regulator [Micromonospora costi]RKN59044.1 LuxR family transcriptional regulator [Micromonospora costi]